MPHSVEFSVAGFCKRKSCPLLASILGVVLKPKGNRTSAFGVNRPRFGRVVSFWKERQCTSWCHFGRNASALHGVMLEGTPVHFMASFWKERQCTSWCHFGRNACALHGVILEGTPVHFMVSFWKERLCTSWGHFGRNACALHGVILEGTPVHFMVSFWKERLCTSWCHFGRNACALHGVIFPWPCQRGWNWLGCFSCWCEK